MCHLCWAKVVSKAEEAAGVHGDEEQWEAGLRQGRRSAEGRARLRRLHTNAFHTPTKACLLQRDVRHPPVSGVKDAWARPSKCVWLSQQPVWWNPLITNALQNTTGRMTAATFVCKTWPLCRCVCDVSSMMNSHLAKTDRTQECVCVTDNTDTLIQNSS